MVYQSKDELDLALRQPINDPGVNPTNAFVKFSTEEIEQSISDRFEKQVDSYSERVAIKTINREITYKKLNQEANRIALSILNQRGRGEEPIALILENGPSMIAAIVAILKVGKMYVPLDPSLPRTRIIYILSDSQAGLIVTNNRNIALSRDLAQDVLQFVNIDELDANLSVENLDLNISPGTLAWVLYTSGSTGKPKGVFHNHRNLLHFIMNYTNGFHINADDRLTLLYSCSVNAGAHDIFSALLNGATLYPWDIKKEGLTRLADWLMQHALTIYSSVPTVFLNFIDTLTGGEKFPALRLIKMMGEPVYRRHVELYKKYFSKDCIFVNRLGSTETGSIRWYFIGKETQITGSNVPVGYPVKDNTILLLDEAGKEVGPGEVGEIAVMSPYLSSGYWRRPNITKAAFLPDLEGGDERIYCTGDLGRMLPDGCLVHMGRKDFQVNIRGHRIEVAEIEMALLDHDDIKAAVVREWQVRPGDQRLVAYIVPAVQQAPTVTELRCFLTEALPNYMIPSTFVILDALPLAPNRKVNRRALPAPDRSRPKLDNPYVAPRTPVEKGLAEIWGRVLDLDQVGISDSFFDLGGNSLLATQIISRVIKTYRAKVLLKSLFQAPTLSGMAVVIAKNQAKKAESKDIERLLAELEALSDEQARRRLADEGGNGGTGYE
ncbi:MAG: AMP-binding protein [Nitrospinales bacterium]